MNFSNESRLIYVNVSVFNTMPEKRLSSKIIAFKYQIQSDIIKKHIYLKRKHWWTN